MKACKAADGEGATFGPDALKILGVAFDKAWAEISGQFNDPIQVEAARFRLASVILSAAEASDLGVEELRRAGLKGMARHHHC